MVVTAHLPHTRGSCAWSHNRRGRISRSQTSSRSSMPDLLSSLWLPWLLCSCICPALSCPVLCCTKNLAGRISPNSTRDSPLNPRLARRFESSSRVSSQAQSQCALRLKRCEIRAFASVSVTPIQTFRTFLVPDSLPMPTCQFFPPVTSHARFLSDWTFVRCDTGCIVFSCSRFFRLYGARLGRVSWDK